MKTTVQIIIHQRKQHHHIILTARVIMLLTFTIYQRTIRHNARGHTYPILHHWDRSTITIQLTYISIHIITYDRYYFHHRVPHDKTSLRLAFKPSRAANQRLLTYNLYYHGNVVKRSLSLQLGGLIRVDHLLCGATPDDHYMIKSKFFEKQQNFAQLDLQEDDKILPFTSILNRGYQLAQHVFQCGKKKVYLLGMKLSNQKSASIAMIRSVFLTSTWKVKVMSTSMASKRPPTQGMPCGTRRRVGCVGIHGQLHVQAQCLGVLMWNGLGPDGIISLEKTVGK